MALPTSVPSIRVYSGDDFGVEFRFKNADGTNADLSAYSDWSAQWRRAAKAEESVPFDVTVTGSTVMLELDAAATRDISDGVFDVQAVSDSVTRTFIRGAVAVVKDVTR